MEAIDLNTISNVQIFEDFRIAIAKSDLSHRTQQNYQYWISRFVTYYQHKPATALDEADVKAFLQFTVLKLRISPAKYKQAVQAINFLFENLLEKPAPGTCLTCVE